MSRYVAPGPDPADPEPLPDEAIAIEQTPRDAADDAGARTHPPLAQRDVHLILASLMLTMFLSALDQTIVATALPTIGRQFHDVGNLSWIITAYLLSSTAVAPLFGTLSDIYGRRAMILTSMALFLVGSVLCALAPNMLTLILARGLQGLGGGGILPLVQTVISDIVTPRERGQYQAYFSAVWMSAGIGGPLLGGVLAEYLHWSMIFWINLPLGALSLALLLPKMKLIPPHHRPRKVDWLGGVLLMAAAVVVVLVLTWGGSRMPWGSPLILAMIGLSATLALTFVWHARRTAEPFLPLPLLGGPVVPYSMIAGGCAIGVIVGMTVTLPLYYETVYRLSASESGLALIPLMAVSVIGAAIAGRVMAKMRRYKWAAILGNLTAMMVMAAIALAPAPLPLWLMLVALAVFALGFGTTFPISVVTIQNAVGRHQIGTATGAMNFVRSLMASFTVAAFSAILLIALGPGVSLDGEHMSASQPIEGQAMIDAFRYVFGAAAVLVGGAALCLILMEERRLAGPADHGIDLAG